MAIVAWLRRTFAPLVRRPRQHVDYVGPDIPLPTIQSVRFRTAPSNKFVLNKEFVFMDRGTPVAMKVVDILPTQNGKVEIVAHSVDDPPEPEKPKSLVHDFNERGLCRRCRMYKSNPRFNHVECPGEPAWFAQLKTHANS